MRQLLLLRHARAAPVGVADIDRPLHQRGFREAAAMGKALALRALRPELVLASPALRVRQTLAAFMPAAGLNLHPRYEDTLYGASVAQLADLLGELPDECRCALLVGHNPGVEDFLERLTGHLHGFTPGTLACVETSGERWTDLDRGLGRLEFILSPQDLE